MTQTAMDPHVAAILRSLTPEEIDMLRDAFIYLDGDSDGFISREELLEGVQQMVSAERYEPLLEYLNPLFYVADKDKDGKLSLTEFLMSFGDGPGVVPADVINSCVASVRVRLSDEEVSALQDNFRLFDKDEDGFLNREELGNALRSAISDKFPDLTEANFDEIIAVVLKSADRNGDGQLSLAEFIRSYQEDQGVLPAAFVDVGVTRGAREISEEELQVLRDAFAVLDKNHDGFIDVADLYQALWEMLASQVQEKGQIRDLCDMIVTTASRGMSGNLSLSDFVHGFLENMELLQIPLVSVKEPLQNAGENLKQMLSEGKLNHLIVQVEHENVPENNTSSSCLDYENMVQLLASIYKEAFPEWDEEILTNVMTAIVVGAESKNSGRLTLDDFIRSFLEGPGIIDLGTLSSMDGSAGGARPYSASSEDLARISEALRTLSDDTDEDGCITLEKLRKAIFESFPESEEGAQRRLEYVLSNFVNQLEDGRLGWNENVQIVEERGSTGDGVRSDEDGGFPREQGGTEGAEPVMTMGEERLQGQTYEGDQKAEDHIQAQEPIQTEENRPKAPEKRVHSANEFTAPPTRSEGNVDYYTAPAEPVQPTILPSVAITPSEVPSPVPSRTVPQTLPSPHATVGAHPVKSQLSPAPKRVAYVSQSRGREPTIASGVGDAIYENELRELFSFYDTKHNGYLDRQEFKKVYSNMEHYGLEPSASQIEALFRRYSQGSDKLYFNEFCVLMLQRVRM